MARSKAAAKKKVAESSNGYAVIDRDPGELHQAFAAWVKTELDETVSPRAVQLAWALRVAFRQSDAYAELRAEKGTDEDESKPARRRGRVAKTEEPDEDAEETKPAPKARSRSRKAPAAKSAAKGGRRTRRAPKQEETSTDDAPF
jgi:hypothetical protein